MALLVVVAVGSALRVASLDRPYWLDEAWVLNSVQAASVGGMLRYEHWVQTTPPGVLLALRAMNGASESWPAAYRLPPIVASIAALLALAVLLARWCTPAGALPGVILAALSPLLVVHGTEAKQFSFDYLGGVIFLWLGMRLLVVPSRARLWMFAAACAVAPAFAYTFLVFLPVFTILSVLVLADRGAAPVPPGGDGRVRAADVLLANGLVGVAALAIYLAMIRPGAAAPELHGYWSAGMLPTFEGSTLHYLRGALRYYLSFVPAVGRHTAGLAALVALALLGAVTAARGAEARTLRKVAWLALLLGPFVVLAALNALGLYPVRSFRLTLFLVPHALLMMTLGLAHAGAWVRHLPGLRRRTEPGHLPAAPALIVALLLAWGLRPAPDALGLVPKQDLRSLAPLLRGVHPDMAVYVHGRAHEEWIFYAGGRRKPPAPVFVGAAQVPCCVPGRRYAPETPDASRLAADFDPVLPAAGARPWLLLLPDRKPGDLAPYLGHLEHRGCDATGQFRSAGYAVFRMNCPG